MASKRHANSKQQRSSLPDPSAVEKDKTLRATICHASDISDVQKRAVEELQRFLELLFGANVVSMVGEQLPERCPAPRETLFILGVPTLSPWIGQILADLDQTPLIEQEYQIRPVEIGHSQALLLAGGSPAAVLWAVYELAEFWGVRFLFDSDVICRREGTPPLPAEPITRKPVFKLRAWRGMNQLPHSGALWGLDDYQKLIDQLAKMRFNYFYLQLYPYMPFAHFEWEGVGKQTGELNFGWRFSIDEQTIGREKIGDVKWFENPDINYEAPYSQKVGAARSLVKEIAKHTRQRGMKFAVSFIPLEFTVEFRRRLRELSLQDGFTPMKTDGGHCSRLGVCDFGADPKYSPFMSIRNPRFIDLAEAQLRAYLQEFSDADYFCVLRPEFSNGDADADFAWQQLAEKYDLNAYSSLEDLIQKVIKDSRSDTMLILPERLRSQVCGDICSLYLLDELLNGRNLSPKRGRLTISMTDAVAPLITHVLGADVEIKCSLGSYLASDAARHIDDLQVVGREGCRGHVVVSLEDDNIGICPQFTAPLIDKILQGMRQNGFEGVWGRQWLLNKLAPVAYFLSHACWDPQLRPHQAYRNLIEGVCGSQAVEPLLEAFKYAEELTLHIYNKAQLHSFLVPNLLLDSWEARNRLDPDDAIFVTRSMCRQLIEMLAKAKAVSLPQGRAFVDQFIDQARFAEQWITVREKLCAAAAAYDQSQRDKTAKDPEGMDHNLWLSVRLLDEAIAASRVALQAWANGARDRADLGALAALNDFGHRCLLALRQQQYLRANSWHCPL